MQQTRATTPDSLAEGATPRDQRQVTRLRDLSPQQWRSGIAAWLGWLFDGLDMHLYTLVATPFVAQLLAAGDRDDTTTYHSGLIQAAFLVGWALGGGFFGRIGDRLGRARALMLTILTYAMFTGLSVFAWSWQALLICRFMAALGIGGEWAVGASLLSETWPRRWRPWIAATLQSAVNCGVLLAMLAGSLITMLARYLEVKEFHRYVFLVGILPALIVVWIRRAVPEPEEWQTAKQQAGAAQPRVGDLFRGSVRRTTILTILVCALSLSAHWVFMYWFLQHLRNLPDLTAWIQARTPEMAAWPEAQRTEWIESQKTFFTAQAMVLVMVTSILGNFLAGMVARLLGYRRAITIMCVLYFLSMCTAYARVPAEGHQMLWWYVAWYVPIGVCQGLFGLFTMYLPPLFPTLLRTTGAGFCYNIGRIAAAAATVFFGGVFSTLGDHRLALFYASFLFLPAAAVALLLSEPPDEKQPAPSAAIAD